MVEARWTLHQTYRLNCKQASALASNGRKNHVRKAEDDLYRQLSGGYCNRKVTEAEKLLRTIKMNGEHVWKQSWTVLVGGDRYREIDSYV